MRPAVRGRRFTGIEDDFDEIAYKRKKDAIRNLFAGEMRRLGQDLRVLAEGRGIDGDHLQRTLEETTACLAVYRTYIRDVEVHGTDRRYIEAALEEASERAGAVVYAAAFAFLRSVLLLEGDGVASLPFVMSWQQVTGPVMAKGIEDTSFYVYNRLISMNEVGGHPTRGAAEPDDFHAFNLRRVSEHPRAMNATSTHDTKRSEDARARINVLSELADEWGEAVEGWSARNEALKAPIGGEPAPDANEELMLYQSLVGTWPLDPAEEDGFRDRIGEYVLKALREAKTHSSWTEPTEAYESAVRHFADAILTEPGHRDDLRDWARRTAQYGAVNSLAQVVLKVAAPGVPDVYRGTELWDFSLVDPDNRRPVDFDARQRALGAPSNTADLLEEWQDGRVKMAVTARSLSFRRDHADLFIEGEYLPLQADASRRQHVVAFACRAGDLWAIAAVPRMAVRLVADGFPVGETAWGGSTLLLPASAPTAWRNVLTGETVHGERELPLAGVFGTLPVALLAASDSTTNQIDS